VYAGVVAFRRWNLLEFTGRPWVGFRNFDRILHSPDFWHSLAVTGKFVAGAVVIELVLGLALALLFFRRFPGDRFLRALLILPMVIAPIVVALLWRFMLNAEYGIINYLGSFVGLPQKDYFSDPGWALPSLVLIDVWQWTPFVFLILLAGLQGIPNDILEAARVDGARGIGLLFHHIIPLLRYPIGVALLLRVIDSFRVYDIIVMTTRGGPIDATDSMSWHIYNVGFRSFDISYAAAYSWLMLIIVVVVCTVLMRLVFRREQLA
jgi:multiple sugar transport system permease protein